MSVPPYLDVNDGTSSASLNHCADGFCASLGLPEQGTYVLTLFPDPATEQLHLAWRATEPPHTLLLLDALGREVMRQPWPRDGRVFVAALHTGVYHALAIGPAGAVLGRARVVKE